MLIRASKGFIARNDSQGDGETWYEGYAISLPNNNNGIDLDRTADGRLFLVCNPVGES